MVGLAGVVGLDPLLAERPLRTRRVVMLVIVRRRTGAFARGSGAPVSATCVGSSVPPAPADVSSANGAMP